MTMWEHDIYPLRNLTISHTPSKGEELDRERTVNDLNEKSKQGWELVAVVPAGVEWVAFLRRPVSR